MQGTVTAGHAFGGDLEAVTVASALGLAAHVLERRRRGGRHGPGRGRHRHPARAPPGSRWPRSSTRSRRWAARPVLCVRASDGDPRDRHRGVSHHTRTALSLTATEPLGGPRARRGRRRSTGVRVVEVVDGPTAAELFDRLDLHVTTMGRTVRPGPAVLRRRSRSGAAARAAAPVGRRRRRRRQRARRIPPWPSSIASST